MKDFEKIYEEVSKQCDTQDPKALAKAMYEKDLGADSIQKWCEEMDKLEREPLTQEEAKTYIVCTMNQDKINKDKDFNGLLGKWNAVSILHN